MLSKNRRVRKIRPKLNYAKTCMWDLSSDINNTPNINALSVKDPSRNLHR